MKRKMDPYHIRVKTYQGMKEMLEHGWDPESPDFYGKSFIHYASKPETIELLKHTNLELRDSQGQTPLMQAVQDPSKFEVCQALIEAGANIHATWDGIPLIHLSSTSQIAKLLIKYGCNLKQLCHIGATPLFYALDSEADTELIHFYLSSMDPNHRCKNGMTPMFFCKTVEHMELLFKYGADPNLKNDFHKTPVQHIKNWELTHYLLQHGASFEPILRQSNLEPYIVNILLQQLNPIKTPKQTSLEQRHLTVQFIQNIQHKLPAIHSSHRQTMETFLKLANYPEHLIRAVVSFI